MGTSLSVPNLFHLTGSAVLARSDGSISPSHSSPSSQPPRLEHYALPMSESLRVRRLVPAKGGRRHRRATFETGFSITELQGRSHMVGAQTTDLVEVAFQSFTHKPLAHHDSRISLMQGLSGPSSSKQQSDTSSSERDVKSQNAHAQEEWKVMAGEAVAWLGRMPQEEHPAAMAEMKEWVQLHGYSWDLWQRYCQALRQNLGLSGKPRLASDAHFNVVPPSMSSYNAQSRSRQNISKAQVQAMSEYPSQLTRLDPGYLSQLTSAMGEHHSQFFTSAKVRDTTMSQQASPGSLESIQGRPQTEEEWLKLVSGALGWLEHQAPEDRESALCKIHEWVTNSGINWDTWWDYCKSVQQARNRAAAQKFQKCGIGRHQPLETHYTPSRDQVAVELPTAASSCCSPGDSPTVKRSRRHCISVDQNTRLKAEAEMHENGESLKEDDDKERRRKRVAEEKAKEKKERQMAAAWEAPSHEKLFSECQKEWKQASRSYSDKLFHPPTVLIYPKIKLSTPHGQKNTLPVEDE